MDDLNLDSGVIVTPAKSLGFCWELMIRLKIKAAVLHSELNHGIHPASIEAMHLAPFRELYRSSCAQ